MPGVGGYHGVGKRGKPIGLALGFSLPVMSALHGLPLSRVGQHNHASLVADGMVGNDDIARRF